MAVNCIRTFPVYGTIVWGARTLQGNDERGSEWKYIPVRRTALFIEESLFRALKWVVFEPNDEPLWAQIRLNVGAFMDLFRQGAFHGKTPPKPISLSAIKRRRRRTTSTGALSISSSALRRSSQPNLSSSRSSRWPVRSRCKESDGSVQRQCTAFRPVQEF